MFAATDTAWAPWFVARSDDKKRARLNIISHLLDHVPYEPVEPHDITLPKRRIHEDSPLSEDLLRHVPERF